VFWFVALAPIASKTKTKKCHSLISSLHYSYLSFTRGSQS
jgi:hypothetical protein